MIESGIPIPIATPDGAEDGILTARLDLGTPAPNGALTTST
jgi:hypothetical protein